MAERRKVATKLLIAALLAGSLVTFASGEALRLPDQQPASQPQQNVQQVFLQQQQQQQSQLLQPQQIQQQQQQQQQQQGQANFGQERGFSSILGVFGLGQDNDPYLARTNQNCLGGDLSECFKTQALGSFDEIFYREQYRLSDLARIVRLPETQQRSLLQEPFEYSQEPLNEDTDWDQLLKYALRRAERFIKSTALEVDVPEELTEAGRYEARFIGNDIDSDFDSEFDAKESKIAPVFKRKKLKKMIIPLLLVLKIFKLKLLLFLPFILGIVGLKKILGLATFVLPGLFAYFKLCRPAGGAGFGGGGGAFSGLFGSKNTYPEYSSQASGPGQYYHHHDHFDSSSGGPYYSQSSGSGFSKPYTDYYSKNYQTSSGAGASNAVQFGDSHEAAYSGYYRNTGKDIQSTQKS